jgi:hypothetical protein
MSLVKFIGLHPTQRFSLAGKIGLNQDPVIASTIYTTQVHVNDMRSIGFNSRGFPNPVAGSK